MSNTMSASKAKKSTQAPSSAGSFAERAAEAPQQGPAGTEEAGRGPAHPALEGGKPEAIGESLWPAMAGHPEGWLHGTGAPMQVWLTLGAQGLQAAARGHRAALDATESACRAVTDFGQLRLREDLEAMAAFGRCQDMAQLAKLEERYIDTSLRHYAAQIGKLHDLGMEAARQMALPLRQI